MIVLPGTRWPAAKAAGVLQPAGLQVRERVRTQAEGHLPVPGPAGADHARTQLVRELHRDRPDPAGAPWIRTVWPVSR